MPPSVPSRRPGAARATLSSQRRVSLCETLDRVLNKGAVVSGDIVISVAGVDLLYLGLNLIVTSVETMRHWDDARPRLAAQAERRLGDGASIRAAPGGTGVATLDEEVRT